MKTGKYLKILTKIIVSKLDGRNQSWLVAQTGINKDNVSRIIKGEREPALDEIPAIAKALNMKPIELLSLVFKEDELGPKELRTAPDVSSGLRILELYQNLRPVRKALVSMLIFDDPAYLADNPDLARAASGILTAEKPKK